MNETKLKIRVWPDPILRRKCKPVETIDDRVRAALEEMRVLMHIHNGIGLAANQAGLDMHMLVCETRGCLFKLINPQITKFEGEVKFGEGCLSFPGIELDVKRAKKIFIEALDENGKPVEMWVDDVLAIVLQHEIDHINGIPFIYRVSAWQRFKISPKLKKLKAKYGLSKPTKKR
jgi:peptide deformylase